MSELKLNVQFNALACLATDFNNVQTRLINLANSLKLQGSIYRQFNKFKINLSGEQQKLSIFEDLIKGLV